MKSGQNNSTVHLGTMRQHRMRRIRRQRANEIGKSVDISLKSMALKSAQQKELSNGVEDPFDWKGCPTPLEPTRRDSVESFVVTRMPAWLKKIEPKHPSEAKRAGKEGKVVLEATIDANGKAIDIDIKENTVGFGCARAAIDSLQASLFRPAKRGVETVSFRIAIPYQFKLED